MIKDVAFQNNIFVLHAEGVVVLDIYYKQIKKIEVVSWDSVFINHTAIFC